jgi:hypothetical protein
MTTTEVTPAKPVPDNNHDDDNDPTAPLACKLATGEAELPELDDKSDVICWLPGVELVAADVDGHRVVCLRAAEPITAQQVVAEERAVVYAAVPEFAFGSSSGKLVVDEANPHMADLVVRCMAALKFDDTTSARLSEPHPLKGEARGKSTIYEYKYPHLALGAPSVRCAMTMAMMAQVDDPAVREMFSDRRVLDIAHTIVDKMGAAIASLRAQYVDEPVKNADDDEEEEEEGEVDRKDDVGEKKDDEDDEKKEEDEVDASFDPYAPIDETFSYGAWFGEEDREATLKRARLADINFSKAIMIDVLRLCRDTEMDIELALAAFVAINTFGYVSRTWSSDVYGVAVYRALSFVRHACVPNAALFFEGGSARLLALRDIAPGEEIRVSVAPRCFSLSRASRNAVLSSNMAVENFECQCSFCFGPEAHERDEDTRAITEEMLRSCAGRKKYLAECVRYIGELSKEFHVLQFCEKAMAFFDCASGRSFDMIAADSAKIRVIDDVFRISSNVVNAFHHAFEHELSHASVKPDEFAHAYAHVLGMRLEMVERYMPFVVHAFDVAMGAVSSVEDVVELCVKGFRVACYAVCACPDPFIMHNWLVGNKDDDGDDDDDNDKDKPLEFNLLGGAHEDGRCIPTRFFDSDSEKLHRDMRDYEREHMSHLGDDAPARAVFRKRCMAYVAATSLSIKCRAMLEQFCLARMDDMFSMATVLSVSFGPALMRHICTRRLQAE